MIVTRLSRRLATGVAAAAFVAGLRFAAAAVRLGAHVRGGRPGAAVLRLPSRADSVRRRRIVPSLGLAETVLGELEAADQPQARAVATTWQPRIDEIRSRAYALADEAFVAGGGPHRLQERQATKVASGEALSVLTRALVVARSGRGLAGDDTAQLHARSALFVLVQGQTADVRAAQLARLAR